jgi:hypothetical protein
VPVGAQGGHQVLEAVGAVLVNEFTSGLLSVYAATSVFAICVDLDRRCLRGFVRPLVMDRCTG